MDIRDGMKNEVMARIATGREVRQTERAKYAVGVSSVHVRYCSENPDAPEKYKYNINPNTLSADYELWICGSSESYYLIPIHVIEQMYNDPDAYPDRRHPEIRVVSVDVERHRAVYARPGKHEDLREYYQATLPT